MLNLIFRDAEKYGLFPAQFSYGSYELPTSRGSPCHSNQASRGPETGPALNNPGGSDIPPPSKDGPDDRNVSHDAL